MAQAAFRGVKSHWGEGAGTTVSQTVPLPLTYIPHSNTEFSNTRHRTLTFCQRAGIILLRVGQIAPHF
jgi:hypothetical protein